MNINYKKEKIQEFIRFVQEKLDDNNEKAIDYIYSNIMNIKQYNKENEENNEKEDISIINELPILTKLVINSLLYENY